MVLNVRHQDKCVQIITLLVFPNYLRTSSRNLPYSKIGATCFVLKSRNWLQCIPPVLCNIVDDVPQKVEETNSSLLYKKKDKSLLAHVRSLIQPGMSVAIRRKKGRQKMSRGSNITSPSYCRVYK